MGQIKTIKQQNHKKIKHFFLLSRTGRNFFSFFFFFLGGGSSGVLCNNQKTHTRAHLCCFSPYIPFRKAFLWSAAVGCCPLQRKEKTKPVIFALIPDKKKTATFNVCLGLSRHKTKTHIFRSYSIPIPHKKKKNVFHGRPGPLRELVPLPSDDPMSRKLRLGLPSSHWFTCGVAGTTNKHKHMHKA